jgi:O-antigen/teichoic acid export membrane protein
MTTGADPGPPSGRTQLDPQTDYATGFAAGERSRRAAGGLLWSSLAVVSQAGGQLVVMAVLARFLTPADFGVVSASLAIVAFGRLVTKGVVGPALTQRATLRGEHITTAYSLSLLIGIASAVLMWILAPLFADFFGMANLVSIARGLCLVFAWQALWIVPLALLQRELAFKPIAVAETLSFVVGFAPIGVALAMAGYGAWALVWAYVGQSAVQAIYLMARRPHERSLRVNVQAAKDLLYYGGGHTTARLFNYAALQGDYIVVGRWLSDTALGIYGRAYQLGSTPAQLIGTALDEVLFPTLSSFQDNRTRLGRAYIRAIALTSTLMFPMAVFGVLLGPEIVAVIFGDGWEGVTVPFQIIAVGLVWRTAYKLSDSLARAAGAVYARAWRQGIYAGLVVVGALVGLRWDLAGVSIAVLIAIFVNYVLMAQLSLKITGVSWARFAYAHVRGVVLGAVTGAIIMAVATPARLAGDRPLVTVTASVVSLCLLLGLPALARPHLVAGDDVVWFARRVAEIWRSKVRTGGR